MSYFISLVKWTFLIVIGYLQNVSGENYCINCGSSLNSTIGNRVFVADKYVSEYLTTPINIMAANTFTSTHLKLYQTSRIFKGDSVYTFPLSQAGRYFIRLHFFPFTYQTYYLSDSKFSVFTQDVELLHDYTPPGFEIVKEYSLNVTIGYLQIFLSPASNSVALLNALEVFLVPSTLIKNDAIVTIPHIAHIGLPLATFKTMYRVNMGGQKVDFNSDPLWRSWDSDNTYLEVNKFIVKVHKKGAIWHKSGETDMIVAPKPVYETCRRLKTLIDPSVSFNITSKFSVTPQFQYLIRLHFCNIISESRDKFYFTLFLNSWLVPHALNLTNLVFGAPIYVDIVTPVITSEDLSISVGPTSTYGINHEAFLNGLEIMKISNSYSLDQVNNTLPSSDERTNDQLGVILYASILGVYVILVIL